MSIKKKLPIIILLLVSASLLILSVLYYSYISNQLITENKDRIQQVLDMESKYLETFFETRQFEVDYLSKNRMVLDLFERYAGLPNNDDPDFRMDSTQLSVFFSQLNDDSEHMRDVFVLSPHGRILASSNVDSMWIDLSDRPYFKDAMAGTRTISSLLQNRVDGESVLFVASPVYNYAATAIIGVIAIIIDMNNTSDGIRQLVDPSVGDAYLIDETGLTVFHTNKSLIGKQPENDQVYELFAHDGNLGPIGSKILPTEDGDLYVAYRSIENTRWRLIIEQNMNVIMASANNALKVMLALALGILLVSCYIAIRYAGSITKPLTQISAVMNETTKGNLGIRVQFERADELGMLSRNLNYMLDELSAAYEDVESKNEELMATEEELRVNYEALKSNQLELKNTQEKYVMALKGARDIIWEWDYLNHHLFVSDMWEPITGRTNVSDRVEIVVFESLLDEREKQRMLKCFQEHWELKTEMLSTTFTCHKPTGEIIWLLLRAHTIWNAEDEPLKITGVLADITAQRAAEERIHNLTFINQISKLPASK